MSRNYGSKHYLLISSASTFVSGATSTFTKQKFSSRVVNAIFDVAAAVNVKNTVFSGALPCSQIEMYRLLENPVSSIFHLEE